MKKMNEFSIKPALLKEHGFKETFFFSPEDPVLAFFPRITLFLKFSDRVGNKFSFNAN